MYRSNRPVADQLPPRAALRTAWECGIPAELMDQWTTTNPGITRLMEPGYTLSEVPDGRLALWGDFDLHAWFTAAPHLFVAEGPELIDIYSAVADTLRTFGEGVQVRWLLDLAGPGAWVDPDTTDEHQILVSELYCFSTPLTDYQIATVTDLIAPAQFGLLPDSANAAVDGYRCVATTWWSGI